MENYRRLSSWVIILLTPVFFTACALDDSIAPPETELNSFNLEIVSYFKDIALGFEFGDASKITRKWGNNSMKIFVGGSPTPALKAELTTVISEINTLATDKFQLEIVTDSSTSNFYIYFGSGENYAKIFPSQKQYIGSNWGLFSVFWNGNDNITGGYMYVDIFRPNATAQRHLLREELTQSLGLARDSPRYAESIFQQNWTTTTSYALIDKELIRLLYHPKVVSGFTASQTESVLTTILLEEQTIL